MPTITVVGLGPGDRGSLTVAALEALRAGKRLYLRTARHPAVDAVRADLRPDTQVRDFDALDEGTGPPEEAAAAIADTLLAAADDVPLVYAVPGHPLIGELSVRLLLDRAAQRGIEVRVVGGLSPLEPVLAALRLDPFARSLQIVTAQALAEDADTTGLAPAWTGPSLRLLNAQLPLLVGPVPAEALLRDLGARLAARYPGTHAVTLVHASGATDAEVHATTVAGLARAGATVAYPFTVYVPPLAPLDDLRAPHTLGYITARLRGPGGCPWDREQTPASLTPYMVEEAYEAVDAIERADDADTVEELGDVLLQVVLHAQIAEEEGRFSLADVAAEVNGKLVRRHPHVFGDVTVSGSSEVLRNWEQIKRAEKGARRTSALDGIPPALPALLLAQTVGRKAAKAGFDWSDVAGTLAKAREELDEIAGAPTPEERRDEVGDLLLALTSVCRHLDIDAEAALRAATHKFAQRFRRVEEYARERRLNLSALSLDELDALWNEAKRNEPAL